MEADFPTERWFWFDPPFHREPVGAAAPAARRRLAHRLPARLGRRSRRGDDSPSASSRACRRCSATKRRFELEWVSVYTFSCLRMEQFRHGRVLFAGDAAHGVSPFGARGANSGVQDADNLAWKLALRAAGRAPEALLDSYDDEREYAADENILQLDAQHRLHHAEERDQPRVPRRGAGAGARTAASRAGSSTAGGCRCRAPPRLAAEHAGHGRLRRPDGARGARRGCAR